MSDQTVTDLVFQPEAEDYEGGCWDIVHNHFDCPQCKQVNASTDMYGPMYECLEKTGDSFTCEECEAKFTLIELALDKNGLADWDKATFKMEKQ